MAIASITLALLLTPTITFVVIFPIHQIIFAQDNVTQRRSEDIQNTATFNTIIAAISGGLVGAAATLIGTYLNNRHNMNLKKQELKHDLGIGLLKHRIECYALVIKYTEPVTSYLKTRPDSRALDDLNIQLEHWFYQEKGQLLMSEISKKKYHDFLNTIEAFSAKNVLKDDDLKEIMGVRVDFNESLQREIVVREE